jgi:hypothetical protein
MTLSRVRLALTALVASVLLALALPVAAAQAATLSPSDEAHFRSVWSSYAVPAATQDALIAEWNAGQVWDSLSGAQPASSSTTSTATKTTRIDRYADGSITITDWQSDNPKKPGGATTQADIGGCYTVSSSQYDITRTCTVHTNVVVSDFSYNVTYYAGQGVYSHIVSKSGLSYNCYGGTCSSPYVSITRQYQTSSQPAETVGGLVYNCYGGSCTRSYFLQFDVTGTSTSALNN